MATTASTAVGKTDMMGNPSMFGTCTTKNINLGASTSTGTSKKSSVGKSISKRANMGKGTKSTSIGRSKGMSQTANMGKKGY